MNSLSRLLPTVALTVIAPVAAFAETPIARRAVDSVVLRNGPKLYGAVLARAKDGTVTLAVRRVWLKTNAPKLYAAESKAERQRAADAPKRRGERIRAWIKERAGEKQLATYLKKELKRLETRKPAGKPGTASQFLLLKIPAEQVRGGYRQPALHRQVAVHAWKERLSDIETRPLKSLVKELRELKKVDISKPVDLSNRLPRTGLETDRQWAARQAIVEFDFLKRVRFQGTGNVLVQAGGDAEKAPDITALFGALYKSQLDELIEEALGNGRVTRKSKRKKWNDALKKAAKTADVAKVRGFRVSRLEPDLARQRVTVEERFIARMPDGQWVTVWRHRETLDASKPRKDLEKAIREDEHVQKALNLVKGLGLGASKAQIATAMRFAAATKLAQKAAENKFLDFRDRYSKSLDAAPLKW